MIYTYLLLCVQCWTPDDWQGNSPKHVEFYSKSKFEKFVHLVGFIIRSFLPLSSAEVKNAWSCTSTQYMCLFGVFSCRVTFWYLLGRNRLHTSGATFVHIIRQKEREKCLIACLRHSVICKYMIFKIHACYVSDNSFLGLLQNCKKATIVYLSVRPHGTTRLVMDGFLWNLIFVYFSKICRENSSFIKISQE
jgi:hypothetical protein